MDVEFELRSVQTHVVYDVRTDLEVSGGSAIKLIGKGCKETVACRLSVHVD